MASGGSRTNISDVNVKTAALDSQHCQTTALLIVQIDTPGTVIISFEEQESSPERNMSLETFIQRSTGRVGQCFQAWHTKRLILKHKTVNTQQFVTTTNSCLPLFRLRQAQSPGGPGSKACRAVGLSVLPAQPLTKRFTQAFTVSRTCLQAYRQTARNWSPAGESS